MDLVKIGKRFKKARIEAKLKQKDAAEKLGISNQVLSFYENGHRDPDFTFVIKLADLYGVSLEYFRVDEESLTVEDFQVELFKQRLKEEREHLGYSKRKLAFFLKVDEEEIDFYETDIKELPPAKKIFELAAVLKVTPDYLGGFVNEKKGVSNKTPKPKDLIDFMEENMLVYEGIPITKRETEKIKNALYLVFLDSLERTYQEIED